MKLLHYFPSLILILLPWSQSLLDPLDALYINKDVTDTSTEEDSINGINKTMPDMPNINKEPLTLEEGLLIGQKEGPMEGQEEESMNVWSMKGQGEVPFGVLEYGPKYGLDINDVPTVEMPIGVQEEVPIEKTPPPNKGVNLYDYKGVNNGLGERHHQELDNYIDQRFDERTNCEDKEKLVKQNLNYPEKCFSSIATEFKQESAFKSCMGQLVKKLKTKCHPLFVKSSGNITYCIQSENGIYDCCFSQAECYTEMDQLLKGWDEEVTQHTMYGLDTMADFAAIRSHYKACFKTYARHKDTGICEEECKKLKNSEFAKSCSKKVDGHKGFFKCCITSDNTGCDICNLCCVLPVCSRVKDGNNSNEFDTDIITKTNITNKTIPNNEYVLEAKVNYQKLSHFCVAKKFQKGKEPYFYNMTEYRAANSIEDMKKLEKTIFTLYPPGSYFTRFNPKDRLLFYNETGPKKLAKKDGYDYCFKLYKDTEGKRSKCVKQCKKLKMESFAKECNKKKHSLFKCCIGYRNWDGSEIMQIETMKTLNKTLQRPCANGKCKFCCLKAFCSTFHHGTINHTMRTPSIIADDDDYHKCVKPNNNLPEYWPAYNKTEYTAAYTKDMMCHVSLKMDSNVPKKIRRKIPTKQKIHKKCNRIWKKRNKRKNKRMKRKNKKKKNKKKKKKKEKKKKKRKNKKSKKKKRKESLKSKNKDKWKKA